MSHRFEGDRTDLRNRRLRRLRGAILGALGASAGLGCASLPTVADLGGDPTEHCTAQCSAVELEFDGVVLKNDRVLCLCEPE